MPNPLIDAAHRLRRTVNALTFPPPVSHVYNPLDYAAAVHEAYLTRFASTPKKVLFLGMNPGPWGMAQTGVPFGEIPAVRDWMGLSGPVSPPPHQHPKRLIHGFSCTKSEVSGRRLWGLFAQRFRTADAFFQDHFVANYCPLVFMTASGANLTPDKLPPSQTDALFTACDLHLRELAQALRPQWVVGVGTWAETRARQALDGFGIRFTRILHPSPANPAANRGWAEAASRQLIQAGIWKIS